MGREAIMTTFNWVPRPLAILLLLAVCCNATAASAGDVYDTLRYLFGSAETTEIASQTRSEAISYLESLPEDKEVHVWPSRTRVYEVLSEDSEIADIVKGYAALRAPPLLLMRDAIGVAELSVVTADVNADLAEREKLLRQTKLLPHYRDSALSARVSTDGCTPYGFISEGTWIGTGFVLVGRDRLASEGPEAVQACIFAALDYLNGLPLTDDPFDYRKLPSADVRGAVMWALTRCSMEPPDPTKQVQRTRDGISPFPDIECAKNSLSRVAVE